MILSYSKFGQSPELRRTIISNTLLKIGWGFYYYHCMIVVLMWKFSYRIWHSKLCQRCNPIVFEILITVGQAWAKRIDYIQSLNQARQYKNGLPTQNLKGLGQSSYTYRLQLWQCYVYYYTMTVWHIGKAPELQVLVFIGSWTPWWQRQRWGEENGKQDNQMVTTGNKLCLNLKSLSKRASITSLFLRTC